MDQFERSDGIFKEKRKLSLLTIIFDVFASSIAEKNNFSNSFNCVAIIQLLLLYPKIYETQKLHKKVNILNCLP